MSYNKSKLNKLFTILLAALFLCCLAFAIKAPSGETSYADGYVNLVKLADSEWEYEADVTTFGAAGTVNNPYLISNAAGMCELSRKSKIVDLQEDSFSCSLTDQYFKIKNGVANIDLTDCGFEPIGQETTFFGYFDGNYCNFELDIYMPDKDNVALFGDIGGQICNLSVSGSVYGKSCVAGVCGEVKTYAENERITGIWNCYNTAYVFGYMSVGGICGTTSVADNNGEVPRINVVNVFNSGVIQGSCFVNGVMGISVAIAVQNAYNLGQIVVAHEGRTYYNMPSSSQTLWTMGGTSGRDTVHYNKTLAVSMACNKAGYYNETNGMGRLAEMTTNETGGLTTSQMTGLTCFDKGNMNFVKPLESWVPIENTLKSMHYPVLKGFYEHSDETIKNRVLAATTTDVLYGSGTEDEPYIIGDSKDLVNLITLCNLREENLLDSHFRVVAKEMDITEISGYEPIGTNDSRFTGVFDGNNARIKIDTLSNNPVYAGLFGVIGESGVVKNVTTYGKISGSEYVGMLAGANYGTIENCRNEGNVLIVEVSDERYEEYGVNIVENISYGCFVGYNAGTITNCSNVGSVSVSPTCTGLYQKYNIGGIVGKNSGTIRYCYNMGNASGDCHVGGIAGRNNSSESCLIEYCYNTGDISSSEEAGGIVGMNGNNGRIESCYNTGNILATSDVSWAGGIAGTNGAILSSNTKIIQCYSVGTVNARYSFGGIVGDNNQSASIQNCYYDSITCFKGYTNNYGEITKLSGFETPLLMDSNAIGADKLDFNADNWVLSPADNQVYYPQLKHFTQSENAIIVSESLFSVTDAFMGEGTSSDPYIIATNTDMKRFVSFVANNRTAGKYFTMRDDIINFDMTPYIIGNTIFYSSTGFEGVFDGNGVNFVIEKTDANTFAMFNKIAQSGVVRNLSVSGAIVGQKIASICLYNYGTIYNCYNASTLAADSYAAGICLENYGTIYDCFNKGEVSADSYVGGIVAVMQDGEMYRCINYGAVSGTTYRGTIAAQKNGGSINTCYYLFTSNSGIKAINNTDYDFDFVKGLTSSQMSCDDLYFGLYFYGFDDDCGWEVGGVYGLNSYYVQLKVFKNHPIEQIAINARSGLYESVFYSGSGTEDSPYLINDIEQYNIFARAVNSGEDMQNLYFQMGSSSPVSYYFELVIIGTEEHPFEGHFDGNFTEFTLRISNVTNGGLFGVIGENGCVSNVRINGYVSGAKNAGGVAAINYGSLYNCINLASISGYEYIGGLCGANYGELTNCLNSGAITDCGLKSGAMLSYNGVLGGIVGLNDGTLINTANRAELLAAYIGGGIVGTNNGKLLNSYNVGLVYASTVLVSREFIIGNIIGLNNGHADYCYFDSDLISAAVNLAANNGISVNNRAIAQNNGENKTNAVEGKTRADFYSCNLSFIDPYSNVSFWNLTNNVDAEYNYYPQLNIFAKSQNESVKSSSKNFALAYAFFTVTYDYNEATGGTEHISDVIYIDFPSNLTVPTKLGYDFDGWYCDGTKVANQRGRFETDYLLSQNITVTARWTLKAIELEAIDDIEVTYSGENIQLQATASHELGVALTYKWYKVVDHENVLLTNETQPILRLLNVSDSGEYFVVVENSANNLSSQSDIITVTISKATFDTSSLTFANAEYTYQKGTVRSLSVVGELPDQVQLSYLNNAKENAGTYTVTASFTVSDNYNEITPLTATLTINKATFDTSSLTFANAEYAYQKGTVRSLSLVGELPDQVQVSYLNNAKENAGVYNVTASFTVSENYNEVILTATLTIKKATFDTSSLTFANAEYTYQKGAVRSLSVVGELPNQVQVSYLNNAKENAGVYTVTASFTVSDNYNEIAPLTARLTINKATFDASSLSFLDKEVEFDPSQSFGITVVGEVPEGITVEYDNNNQQKVGTYLITARFGASDNYNPIQSLTAELTIYAKAAVSDGAVEIDLSAQGEVDEAIIQSGDLQDDKGLKIGLSNGTIEFDSALTQAIKNQAGNEKLSVKIKDAKDALSEAQKAVVGDRPVFDITIGFGNTFITEFNGKVKVTLPYSLREGENKNRITVFYLDSANTLVEMEECEYDEESQTVTFYTNHFSNYVIGLKEGSNTTLIIVICVSAVALVIIGFSVYWFGIKKRSFASIFKKSK